MNISHQLTDEQREMIKDHEQEFIEILFSNIKENLDKNALSSLDEELLFGVPALQNKV